MTESDTNATWVIPATTVRLPDGSTLVKPGKAVQRASLAVTRKITGVSARTLHALAECGLIRREQVTPYQSFFYPGEVEALLAQTAVDPNFWDQVRTQAFLTGKDLRNSKPK
jgi:hypothetical protein